MYTNDLLSANEGLATFAAEIIQEELNNAGLEHVAGINTVDMGCGLGRVTAKLREQYPAGLYVGIDCDPRVLRMARKEFPDITFVSADVSNTKLESSSVSLVFSVHVLDYATRRMGSRRIHFPSMAREITRVLAPGGVYVAFDRHFDEVAFSEAFRALGFEEFEALYDECRLVQKL